jgi:hypothetical protein
MNILTKLWRDEAGLVMSAETVMLGTVGVLGVVAGVGVMTSAVNDEMGELGMAFRGFDQSYSVAGTRVSMGGMSSSSSGRASNGFASKAGSGFQQEPTQKAIERVRLQMMEAEVAVQRLSNESQMAGQVEVMIEEQEVLTDGVCDLSQVQGRESRVATGY